MNIQFEGQTHQFPDDFTDADIAKALAGHRQPTVSMNKPDVEVGQDLLKTIPGAVLETATSVAGIPGDIGSLASLGAGKIGEMSGAVPDKVQQFKDAYATFARFNPMLRPFTGPTSRDLQEKAEDVFGKQYAPQTMPGEYLKTLINFLPAALGPGGMASRIAQVVMPALVSETAGQITKGESEEPYARVIGALGGAMAPAALSRLVSPSTIPAANRQFIETLRKEGIQPTAGQTTSNRAVKYAESELGDAFAAGGKTTAANERIAEQFTAASLRRSGENATRATPEVIDSAFTRIGQRFDDLAARNRAVVDTQLDNQLHNAVMNYRGLVAPPNRAPIVDNFLSEIYNVATRSNGVIPGDIYQSLRSRMERASRSLGQNPEAQNTIREMRGALDDVMERSIAQIGNKSDLTAWRQARNQYRNMLVIERAVTAAGSDAASGLISPSALRNATINIHGRRNYARGKGDFEELARAGEAIMKPLPQSGTAPRLAAHLVPSMLGAVGGAGAGSQTEMGAIPGMIAGALAPGILGRALMSRPGQAYMRNQLAVPLRAGNFTSRSLPAALALQPRLQFSQ